MFRVKKDARILIESPSRRGASLKVYKGMAPFPWLELWTDIGNAREGDKKKKRKKSSSRIEKIGRRGKRSGPKFDLKRLDPRYRVDTFTLVDNLLLRQVGAQL